MGTIDMLLNKTNKLNYLQGIKVEDCAKYMQKESLAVFISNALPKTTPKITQWPIAELSTTRLKEEKRRVMKFKKSHLQNSQCNGKIYSIFSIGITNTTDYLKARLLKLFVGKSCVFNTLSNNKLRSFNLSESDIQRKLCDMEWDCKVSTDFITVTTKGKNKIAWWFDTVFKYCAFDNFMNIKTKFIQSYRNEIRADRTQLKKEFISKFCKNTQWNRTEEKKIKELEDITMEDLKEFAKSRAIYLLTTSSEGQDLNDDSLNHFESESSELSSNIKLKTESDHSEESDHSNPKILSGGKSETYYIYTGTIFELQQIKQKQYNRDYLLLNIGVNILGEDMTDKLMSIMRGQLGDTFNTYGVNAYQQPLDDLTNNLTLFVVVGTYTHEEKPGDFKKKILEIIEETSDKLSQEEVKNKIISMIQKRAQAMGTAKSSLQMYHKERLLQVSPSDYVDQLKQIQENLEQSTKRIKDLMKNFMVNPYTVIMTPHNTPHNM